MTSAAYVAGRSIFDAPTQRCTSFDDIPKGYVVSSLLRRSIIIYMLTFYIYEFKKDKAKKNHECKIATFGSFRVLRQRPNHFK